MAGAAPGILKGEEMKDRDFLMWLHERLEYVHYERPGYDYMHKLRDIIASIPKEQESKQSNTNNLAEIRKMFRKKATP